MRSGSRVEGAQLILQDNLNRLVWRRKTSHIAQDETGARTSHLPRLEEFTAAVREGDLLL